MAGVWGNYHLTPSHSVPSYQLADPIIHVTKYTTLEEITEFYNSHRHPGASFTAMTADRRLEFYRSHLPKMEYKGFIFYMDLARNGKPEDFLTIREIRVEGGKIKLWKVVSEAKAALVKSEGGFDPDWAQVPGSDEAVGAAQESSGQHMPQLRAADSGKTYFACRPDYNAIYIEYASGPTETLEMAKPPEQFNYMEFVFNSIDQVYTSHIVLFP